MIPGNSINLFNILRKHSSHEETMIEISFIINYY